MREWLKKHDTIYFMLTNKRFVGGMLFILSLILLSLIGPWLARIELGWYIEEAGKRALDPTANIGTPYSPPSPKNWLGTNSFGQDVFLQLVYGLRSSLLVGIIGGGLATVVGLSIGFISGYSGGMVDETLMMLTNIMLVIPTMAVLIIIAAYLPYRGVLIESLIIGLTGWPWTARAVRSETLSLKSREFVHLARISAVRPLKIVFGEIAPNMLSYVFMVFILQFGGSILAAVGLDFIGLGPTRGTSLGIMLQQAVLWNAIQLGMWWWIIPPGAIITALIAALYTVNTGLDEAFNPRLREM